MAKRICNFLWVQNAIHKPLPETFVGRLDAANLYDIDSGAEDHAG